MSHEEQVGGVEGSDERNYFVVAYFWGCVS